MPCQCGSLAEGDSCRRESECAVLLLSLAEVVFAGLTRVRVKAEPCVEVFKFLGGAAAWSSGHHSG